MSEMFIAPATEQNAVPVPLNLSGISADLNMITQKVCSRLSERFSQSGAIIRCDDLPQVLADDNEIFWVFEHAVNIILNSSLPESKLLIHIKTAVPSAAHFVHIDVCTNCRLLSPLWGEQEISLLEKSKIICKKFGGTFIYNAAHGGTSLFTIVLPAKQNITTLG